MFRTSQDVVIAKVKDRQPQKVKREVQCDMCSETYESDTEVEIHRKTAHAFEIDSLLFDPKVFICKLCFHQQPDKETLLSHFKVEHLLSGPDAVRIEREIFICDYCSQLFFNKHMLATHMIMHEKKQKRRDFACPKCLKVMSHKCLWVHLQSHLIQSVSCCPICLTKLNTRKDLKEHLKTHPYHLACDICGHVAKNRNLFRNHCKNHHRKVAVHTDDAAMENIFVKNKGFIRQSCIVTKGVSLSEYFQLCILCRELLTDTDSMRIHVQEHRCVQQVAVSEKKKYVCTCGQEFFNYVLLKQHVFKTKNEISEEVHTEMVIRTAS